MSIANMTTEWGALVGWFPADPQTFAFLRERRLALGSGADGRLVEGVLRGLEANPPAPDKDAVYAAKIKLDLSRVTPHVSGPDTVQVMASVAEMAKKKVAIQKAYLLSCVNSRLEDLGAAARVLAGKKIAPTVKFYVAAASKDVQTRAEEQGYWKTLAEAGATFLPPSCGPCIGLGTGLLDAGEVGISATNRNFKGRMGSRDAKCYLASPAVVASSALAGYITGPVETPEQELKRDFVELTTKSPRGEG